MGKEIGKKLIWSGPHYYICSFFSDGPGIPDKNKATLFNPERRFGGVGIHQAKQIAEKFGGCISVADRIDGAHSEGASFKIWIPRKTYQNEP